MPPIYTGRSLLSPLDQSGKVVLTQSFERKRSNNNPGEMEEEEKPAVRKTKTVENATTNVFSDQTSFQGFPFRLMELMDNEELQDAIYWFGDGTHFGINTSCFEEKVLQPYFQGSKMESFARKLSRWGFKRVFNKMIPPDTVSYRHEMFQKGRRDLLPFVRAAKTREFTHVSKRREFLPYISKIQSQTSFESVDTEDDKNSIIANTNPTREIILEQATSSNSSEIQSATCESQNLVQAICKPDLHDTEQQRKISEVISTVRLRMLKREQEMAEKLLLLQSESIEGNHSMLQGQPMRPGGLPILPGQSILPGLPLLQGEPMLQDQSLLPGQPLLQDQSVPPDTDVLQQQQIQQEQQQQAPSIVILPAPINIQYVVALPASMSGPNNLFLPVQQFHQQPPLENFFPAVLAANTSSPGLLPISSTDVEHTEKLCSRDISPS